MNLKKLTTTVCSLLLTAGMSAGAMAQPGQQGQAPQGQPQQGQPQQGQAPGGFQQQEPIDVSDEDLQNFVDVQSDLQEIRVEYSGRLEEAGDAEEAASLQQEASEQMVETLEENDLTVETYTQIANALQSDQELRSRVESMMNESS